MTHQFGFEPQKTDDEAIDPAPEYNDDERSTEIDRKLAALDVDEKVIDKITADHRSLSEENKKLETEIADLKREKAIGKITDFLKGKSLSDQAIKLTLSAISELDLQIIGNGAEHFIPHIISEISVRPELEKLLNPGPRESFQSHMSKKLGIRFSEGIDTSTQQGKFRAMIKEKMGITVSENLLLPENKSNEKLPFEAHMKKCGILPSIKQIKN
jgi:hypothetical protein